MTIIFNLLLGFSLGLIFSSFVIKKVIFHGPNSIDVQKKKFKNNNICYRFVPTIINCDFFNSHIKL